MASDASPQVLVDANVLLDVFGQDPAWFDWSAGALAKAVRTRSVGVNPIIYAEVSANFEAIEDLEDALPASDFERLPLPWPAAFLAGRSYIAYRRSGGQRRSPLPDFYIGAHAAVEGMTLLTRDSTRYRTYFPTVELITP